MKPPRKQKTNSFHKTRKEMFLMESSKVKGPSPIEQIARLCLDAGMGDNEAVCAFRTHLIREALRRNCGNVCRTARVLRHHRNTISRIIEQLHLREFALSCRVQQPRRIPSLPVDQRPRTALPEGTLLLHDGNRLDQSRAA